MQEGVWVKNNVTNSTCSSITSGEAIKHDYLRLWEQIPCSYLKRNKKFRFKIGAFCCYKLKEGSNQSTVLLWLKLNLRIWWYFVPATIFFSATNCGFWNIQEKFWWTVGLKHLNISRYLLIHLSRNLDQKQQRYLFSLQVKLPSVTGLLFV